MAKIMPFRAMRPKAELAREIAALPYDVYNEEEARTAAKHNPYSFLHVDKAEIDMEKGVSPYDKSVYEKAATNLSLMVEKGWLFEDAEEMLYIYRLEMDGRRQTGIVALTSIDEYINGTIKRHELTREEKETDRTMHIKSCKAHTGPIFLAYRADTGIRSIIGDWTETTAPEYDFLSDDGVRHTVWKIDVTNVNESLISKFKNIEQLFIADGHHRNAAAVRVGLEMREQNAGYAGAEQFARYLSVLFPDDELTIMAYNRVLKDLNGLSTERFISAISEKFVISREEEPVEPKKRHEFGLYIGGSWYRLCLNPEFIDEESVLSSLDVSLLQEHIIEPLLGVKDVRNDKRIDFVGGIRGVSEISRIVDGGEMAVGFTLYPTSLAELMSVAESGAIMPPKSTWFEPKLRSGLFIHNF